MENRETHKIKTPVNKDELELKSWITGREKRDLRNVFLKEMNFSLDKESKDKKIDVSKVEEAEDNTIKLIVISINGKKEKILNTILSMRSADYDFVIEEINKITKETGFLA